MEDANARLQHLQEVAALSARKVENPFLLLPLKGTPFFLEAA